MIDTDDASAIETLRAAHDAVLGRIAAAADRADRDSASVTLVAVSKTVLAEQIGRAAAAGMRTFGENRVQEALGKQPSLAGLDLTWHLVGPLQSNKARKAIDGFDVIETVDSPGLARRIDQLRGDARGGGAGAAGPAGPYPILLQVNVDADPAKAGLQPEDVEAALREIKTLTRLRVDGLMTVGRLVPTPEDARSTFRGLRELSVRMRDLDIGLGPELSMGMTDDFEVAVEEGATIVRVGRALFGERAHHHGDGALDHTH